MRLIDADVLKEKSFGKRGGLVRTEDIDNAPTVQPTVADCCGCNCPKMERLKEQKTFSEMVHLHDTETHDKRTETHACDCISRKDAIRWIKTECNPYGKPTLDFESGKRVMKHLEQMPSAQSERTCVNCGRTANNGGWYADGRTRCPIEEHYALPKDGYCHLWEKRNVTDDDYPERRTDE